MNAIADTTELEITTARKSLLLMLAFVGLWAVVEVIATPVFAHISPYEVVWVRYGVHLAFMLLIWGWRDPAVLWRTQRPFYQIGRSLLMLGMPASWIIADQHGVPPGALMSIFWFSPLLVLALAQILLRERVRTRYWIAGTVGYVGACLVSAPVVPRTLSDFVFPMGMGATFALYVVMTRALRHETLQANLFYTALGVFVALSVAMPSLWVIPSAHDAFALVLVGLLGFVALLALDRSASIAPLSASASYIYVQAPITFALTMFLSNAHPVARTVIGIGLVGLVGAYLWIRRPESHV
jgi:drug/metabolite transporter (DMT)-like permease